MEIKEKRKRFLIDSASVKDTEEILGQLDLSQVSYWGNTTNPRIFEKENNLSLGSWFKALEELSSFISNNFESDNTKELHIQFPNSNGHYDDILSFTEDALRKVEGKGVKLVLKLPHDYRNLNMVPSLRAGTHVDINITGTTDAATVLRAFNFGAKYASIIPGRMEEAGLEPYEHLDFLSSFKYLDGEIITGSMRSFEGVFKAITHGTIPTIGTKVLFEIIKEGRLKEFYSCWNYEPNNKLVSAPIISEEHKTLSKGFFEQMDECGKEAYGDLNIPF